MTKFFSKVLKKEAFEPDLVSGPVTKAFVTWIAKTIKLAREIELFMEPFVKKGVSVRGCDFVAVILVVVLEVSSWFSYEVLTRCHK